MDISFLRKLAVAFGVCAVAIILTPRNLRAQQDQLTPVGDDVLTDEEDFNAVKGLDLRSNGKQMADIVRHAAEAGTLVVTPDPVAPNGDMSSGNGNHDDDLRNIQVNDPALDNIQSFPGTRPFEESTQSETSIASFGKHVLVGYNSSAGEPIVRIGGLLFATKILFSAYSISHDGGKTWSSHFLTPTPGSVLTFGDPAVGVDRNGNFYYAGLGGDAVGNTVISVGKSTDHGDTFAPAAIVATDNGGDKDWLAVGPDPAVPGRDNLYVTWTSFQAGGAQLRMGKSIDGGATWTTKTLFAPVANAVMSSFIQFSNPVVDATAGRLYIPFLHFSNLDADMIRVLVSDDGGETFRFLAFNVPGAPDAFAFPNVTPGEFTDCGRANGGFRNVLHQGANLGGGRFGFARYRFATRLITQPSAAAVRGRLFLAFNSSTSPFFGDPASRSMITVLFSNDGGNTWADPLTVAASTSADPQHVHPAISVKEDGDEAHVGYYVQQNDSRLRTDLTRLKVDDKRLRVDETKQLSSVTFDLTPSNNPFPIAGNAFFTTNYDRTVRACYNLGEYLSLTTADDGVRAAWGDNRQTWTSPAGSSFPGTHAQADVVFAGDED